MVLLYPEPLETPQDEQYLLDYIADLEHQLAVHAEIGTRREHLPHELRMEPHVRRELARAKQELLDLPAKRAAKAAMPMRPYALTLRIGGKVEIWVCTRCGTGTIRQLSGGSFDGRDLHDQHCPVR